MKLQTKIPIAGGNPKIDYSSKVLLLGSCFSENIGKQFQYYKFQVLQNPFGILFHPFAIENFLKRVVTQENYAREDVFQHHEIWSCFDAHSRLNALTEDLILEKLNSALTQTYRFIKLATHIVITFGTSWGYMHLKSKKYVANCHKIPQKYFKKELSLVTEIQQSIQKSVRYIRQINPNAHFIFTTSPVRHLKDGFVENQQSKAHLIAALHQYIQIDKNAIYFPSYELMMDELRDYRFYAEDLLHPNKIAIQYIWEKFVETWVSEEAINVMKDVGVIQSALQHKPFNPSSVAHLKFQENVGVKIEELTRNFPYMKFK